MKKRFACFIAGVMAMFMLQAFIAAQGQATASDKARKGIQRLEGRWVRPDGGYVLELSEIKTDGSLKAAYFNPRPINVYQAKYKIKQGKITLLVELRDVNYPGSTYRLQYNAERDRLEGSYFQAVERQTYQVHFIRSP